MRVCEREKKREREIVTSSRTGQSRAEDLPDISQARGRLCLENDNFLRDPNCDIVTASLCI